MKRKVSVCAGVMVALVAVSANAQEPQPAPTPAPATEAASAPAPSEAPVAPAPEPAPTVSADAPMVSEATVSRSAPDAEAQVPFEFSVVPGLSTRGVSSGHAVNRLAVGVIATRSGRLDGLALALGGTWVDRTVSGAQLSLAANLAGGDVSGLQLTTGVNVARAHLSGIQGSVGLNFLRGELTGAQLTTGANLAGGVVNGLQGSVGFNLANAGLTGAQLATGVNLARGSVRGLQASAGLNVAPGDMVGLQASSGINYAANLQGAQLSLLNVGGDILGAQVGLINVARKAKGLQLGLINVASESEGTPIGLLSIAGNGQFHVQAWASDVALSNVALKVGGKYVHTLFAFGFHPDRDGRQRRFNVGLGFGGHIPLERFFLDIDVVASSLHSERLFTSSDDFLGQLRLVGGFHVARRFALIAGVTGNTLVSGDGEVWSDLGTGSRVEWERRSGDTRVRVWPGVLLGIQL